MKLRIVAGTALIVFALASSPQAQLYWDTNGSDPGASDGSGNAIGTWDNVTSNWNPNADGTGATQAWVPDSDAVFSAGSDATGTYTVTINGTVSASAVTFEEPFALVTIAGGQLTLVEPSPDTQPTVTVPVSGVARIDSAIGGSAGLMSAGEGVLILGGANTYSGSTLIAPGNVLRLGAAGTIPDTSVITLTSGNPNTAFQLNGFDETVKSIATTGIGTAPTIALGTNTLTLQDDGETQTFTGLYTSSPGGKIIKNGSGTLNLNNFPSGFVGGEIVLNNGTIGVGQNNVFGTNGNDSKLTINGGTIMKIGTTSAGSNWGVKNVDINASFTFDINGSFNTQLIGGSAASAGNMIITLGADNPTITVVPAATGTSGVLIFAGRVLNGAGDTDRGFTKAGSGTLILGNRNNDYRGETTIQEGTLRVINQFFNANSVDNNGAARIGDGTGRVNLSGGTLQYNGTPQVSPDGTSNTGGARTIVVTNPLSLTTDSSIQYFTTANQGTDEVVFEFTSDEITSSGGTLTFNRDTSNANTLNVFKPTFSGSGFDFTRPVVISQESESKRIELTSANSAGTQTWSGAISGDGSYRRSGGGTTVFTAANSFSGGATVEGGTLRASGTPATFGGGDVIVTGGALEIDSGVTNAIADGAMLSLLGGGSPGVADDGYLMLGSGIDERVADLLLNGVQQAPGTYGSSVSSATFKLDEYFAGMGILTVAPVAGLQGDYNDDGKVDAADYVLWRKNPDNFGGDPAGYDTWRANFGSMAGAGGDAGLVSAVPEPNALALALLALGVATARRRRN